MRMPEKQAKMIVFQLANALSYLHRFGIMHRDLKLENIMMTEEGDKAQPKIVDFGLSKIIGPTEKANEPFGTLGYIAPEILDSRPYSFPADMWSLGCITYSLISGCLPFDHNDEEELVRRTI